MLTLHNWAPTRYDFTIVSRDEKIAALQIDIHERELLNIGNNVNILKQRVIEIDESDVTNYFINMKLPYEIVNYTGLQTLQFEHHINGVLTTFNISDIQSHIDAVETLKKEIVRLSERLSKLSHLLAQAYCYKREIEMAYRITLEKKNEIVKHDAELNSLTKKYDDKKAIRNELLQRINKIGRRAQASLEYDKYIIEAEISTLILLINNERNIVNKLYQDINVYNTKFYYISW